MKRLSRSLIAAVLGLCCTTQGALFDSGFANDGLIPDGNLAGWSDTREITGLGAQITDVSVRLEFGGGYNGDLYAYLSHNGTLVPLLNRVGTGTGSGSVYEFGFANGGMNVTLSDSGTVNIHDVVPSASGGVYAPDGRLESPLAGGMAINGSGRVGFSVFNGMDPNGAWTLFFADVSGGSQSQVQAWNLEISAVPEPVNLALGIFGGIVVLGLVWKRIRGGNQEKSQPAGQGQ